MLAKVSGCSWPSTLLLASMIHTSSSSASFHRPWFEYVDARLSMMVKESGWSCPSIFLLVSVACTSSPSASLHRPWLRYADARLDILAKVSGCSWPSTLFLVSLICTSSSSASFHRPWLQNVEVYAIYQALSIIDRKQKSSHQYTVFVDSTSAIDRIRSDALGPAKQHWQKGVTSTAPSAMSTGRRPACFARPESPLRPGTAQPPSGSQVTSPLGGSTGPLVERGSNESNFVERESRWQAGITSSC